MFCFLGLPFTDVQTDATGGLIVMIHSEIFQTLR